MNPCLVCIRMSHRFNRPVLQWSTVPVCIVGCIQLAEPRNWSCDEQQVIQASLDFCSRRS